MMMVVLRHRRALIGLVENTGGNKAFFDFTQRHDGWLVILFRNKRRFTENGQLAGALAADQNQFETVIYVIQTIFNSNSRHLLIRFMFSVQERRACEPALFQPYSLPLKNERWGRECTQIGQSGQQALQEGLMLLRLPAQAQTLGLYNRFELRQGNAEIFVDDQKIALDVVRDLAFGLGHARRDHCL